MAVYGTSARKVAAGRPVGRVHGGNRNNNYMHTRALAAIGQRTGTKTKAAGGRTNPGSVQYSESGA